MRYNGLIGGILFFFALSSFATEKSTNILGNLEKCRQIISSLERLDCYDNTWDVDKHQQNFTLLRSKPWIDATEQEKNRSTHSVNFIMTEKIKDDVPQVLITTPAVGNVPPRSILMLSCIDNITRLQLIFHQPIEGRTIPVSIQTDRKAFNSQWLNRDSGYILEASRGLQGINEIQQLFGASKLTVKVTNSSKEWVFNIENLEQEITSLRQACHW